MRRRPLHFFFALLGCVLITGQSTASARSRNKFISASATVPDHASKDLTVPMHRSPAVTLNPRAPSSSAPPSTPPVVTLTPALRTATVSESHFTPSGESSQTVIPTQSVTPDHQETSVEVYFQITDDSLTPEGLIALLLRVVWKNAEEVHMVSLPSLAPWARICIESISRAEEAFAAANKGSLPGVARAVYEAPSVTPDDGGRMSAGAIVAIITGVIIVIIVVGFVLFWLFFRKVRRGNKRGFDEDDSINLKTQSINLNEVLLLNLNDNPSSVPSDKSPLLKQEKEFNREVSVF